MAIISLLLTASSRSSKSKRSNFADNFVSKRASERMSERNAIKQHSARCGFEWRRCWEISYIHSLINFSVWLPEPPARKNFNFVKMSISIKWTQEERSYLPAGCWWRRCWSKEYLDSVFSITWQIRSLEASVWRACWLSWTLSYIIDFTRSEIRIFRLLD